MKRILPLLLCTMLVASFCLAEDPPPPPAEEPAPDAKPAPSSKPIPDHCKGVIDPFNAGEERSRFFRAAGVDSDLSPKEAEANRKATKPFVRKFDLWKTMVSYDKGRDGQLDWYEALEYRKAFRKRVISAFDGNKDGRLAGKERVAANRALAAGKVPAGKVDTSQIYIPDRSSATEGGTGGGAAPGGRGGFGGEDFRQRFLEEFDTNKDGELDEEERAAMREGFRKRMEDWRQRRELGRYDKDGDGELNEAEQGEADKGRAEREERMGQWRERMEQRRAEWTQQWDKDGDGQLNDEERAAMREGMAERGAQMGRQIGEILGGLTDRYDADGDGNLNEEERAALRDDVHKRFSAIREEADADGDGEVSTEERDAIRKSYTEKYDADGDGELSAEERATMVQEEMKKFLNAQPAEPE